jgi:hypothetical protein
VERSSKTIVRALSCTRKGILYKALQRMKEDESRWGHSHEMHNSQFVIISSHIRM